MDKPIESVLKLDESFGIPKKLDDKEVEIDEIEIIDKMEDIEDRLKEREREIEK